MWQYAELAGTTVVGALIAGAWWPDLSGPLRRPIGRGVLGGLWGAVWGLFVARYSPLPAGEMVWQHMGFLIAGLWAMGAGLWTYRSTYLWMVAVNLPLGMLHWPLVFVSLAVVLVTGREHISGPDGVLLWITATGLWAGALRLMVVSRRGALPPARRRNVQRLFAWLSRTPVWPPPPMPEELPPSEIMDDIEGGWARFLDQQSGSFFNPQS